jgi:hypothetical protein
MQPEGREEGVGHQPLKGTALAFRQFFENETREWLHTERPLPVASAMHRPLGCLEKKESFFSLFRFPKIRRESAIQFKEQKRRSKG